jgi:hypothetical protein
MKPKTSRWVLALPLLGGLLFCGFAALPQARADPILLKTFLIIGGLLAAWAIGLSIASISRNRALLLEVALLKQHYVQACVHTSILLYWGWYWRPVYDHAYLILAQLIFAFTFDMLLQLSRHGKYTLGFGPFPIVFSINLFLWFKNDWFYYQFLIIAVGLAAKEFLRWNRGGRWVHIFNPSSFPLAIASWILLFTHQFGITQGEQIAVTQFSPPHIYVFIFVVSMAGQFFFGVASMTRPAVLTMYLWGYWYMASHGIPYLNQAYVPIAVFLAMHLLFTDPSTSPRTELGRIFFGILYAATVVGLELVVNPGFPAKLLLVPVLNLSVKGIDKVAQWRPLRFIDPGRIAPQVTGRPRNLAYMAAWAAVFSVLISLGGIGDRFPGQNLPFWFTACRTNTKDGCFRLAFNLDLACHRGSGWGCNYLAIMQQMGLRMPKEQHVEGQLEGDADATGAPSSMQKSLSSSCELGFQPGCENLERMKLGEAPTDAPPALSDLPILLSLYKFSRRAELEADPPSKVFAEACRGGWKNFCNR